MENISRSFKLCNMKITILSISSVLLYTFTKWNKSGNAEILLEMRKKDNNLLLTKLQDQVATTLFFYCGVQCSVRAEQLARIWSIFLFPPLVCQSSDISQKWRFILSGTKGDTLLQYKRCYCNIFLIFYICIYI